MIADWCISPGLWLVRDWLKSHSSSSEEKSEKRLDGILLKKAMEVLILHLSTNDLQGVRVTVLLWNAPNVPGLDLQTNYVLSYLNGLHSNIVALAHPNNNIPWSHNQKIVVVDDQVAFVGGISTISSAHL